MPNCPRGRFLFLHLSINNNKRDAKISFINTLSLNCLLDIILLIFSTIFFACKCCTGLRAIKYIFLFKTSKDGWLKSCARSSLEHRGSFLSFLFLSFLTFLARFILRFSHLILMLLYIISAYYEAAGLWKDDAKVASHVKKGKTAIARGRCETIDSKFISWNNIFLSLPYMHRQQLYLFYIRSHVRCIVSSATPLNRTTFRYWFPLFIPVHPLVNLVTRVTSSQLSAALTYLTSKFRPRRKFDVLRINVMFMSNCKLYLKIWWRKVKRKSYMYAN